MMPLKQAFSLIKKCGGYAIAFLLLTCYSCENDLTKLPGNGNLKDLDADRASEVTFIYSENGVTKAKLYTKDFVGNENARPPYIDFNNGVKMELYNDSLKVDNVITAKTARYYTKEGNVLSKGNVVAKNVKGDKLETDELIWNQRLARFYTEKNVKITANGQITTGRGLEANRDFSLVRIKNQLGSIPVNNKDLPTE